MCGKFLKLIILLFLTLTICNGHLATKRLYEDLLSDYNRQIRPVININDTIFVNLSLKLTQLLDINMKQQVMSTNVWVEQNWFDFQLQWNPLDYDGVDMIYIPAEEIWEPNIVLFNNADGIYEVASMTKALVYHTGEGIYEKGKDLSENTNTFIQFYDGFKTVHWKPPALFKSTCEIDVLFFPFDIQICSMKFASWTYDGGEVDLRSVDKSYSVKPNTSKEIETARLIQGLIEQNSTTNHTANPLVYNKHTQPEEHSKNSSAFEKTIEVGIDMSEFYSSVEWDVLAVPAHYKREYFAGLQNPYPEITFKIKLRRKTLFYTVNLIIPIVGNAFMTLLVFFLPSDSGEKVALSISLLVSLTVFFLLLAETIPPTSIAVPLLGKYLLFTMILITLSICCTVGILNIHYRSLSTHIMQPWVRRLFIEILPKYLLMHRPTIKDCIKELRALSKPNKFEFTTCAELENNSDHALSFFPAPATRSYYGYQGMQSTNTSFDEDQIDKSAFVYNFNPNMEETELLYDTDLGMPSIIFPQIRPRNLSNTSDSLLKKFSISQNSSPTIRQQDKDKDKEITGHGNDIDQAIHSILTIAEHLKREDEEKNSIEDWKYVGMTLDRLFLIMFTFICVVGSIIILQAPSLYDLSPAIESPSLRNLVISSGS